MGAVKWTSLALAATVPFLAGGMLMVAVPRPANAQAARHEDRPVAAAKEKIIEVVGPTLIAFFPRLTERMIAENPSRFVLLDDFYHHLNAIGPILVNAGVRVYARPAGVIRILDSGRVRTLTPPPTGSDLGYYMVAPGLEEKLLLGAYTDVDLMDAVDQHIPPDPPDPDGYGTFENDIDYSVEEDALHVFGHVLQPKFNIKLADFPEDDDVSSISFPSSGDGRWVVIVHKRDVNSVEFWLYDRRTGEQPVRLPVGPGRHGEVRWHGDEIFEISFAGIGYTLSRFVHVARPEESFEVRDLLHYDDDTRVYISFVPDGVEVGRLFEQDESSRKRVPLGFDYFSAADARTSIETVDYDDGLVTVTHRRQDGSLARQSFRPILQH